MTLWQLKVHMCLCDVPDGAGQKEGSGEGGGHKDYQDVQPAA